MDRVYHFQSIANYNSPTYYYDEDRVGVPNADAFTFFGKTRDNQYIAAIGTPSESVVEKQYTMEVKPFSLCSDAIKYLCDQIKQMKWWREEGIKRTRNRAYEPPLVIENAAVLDLEFDNLFVELNEVN